MTPPCTHGCADPRMCPTCRRTPALAAPEPLDVIETALIGGLELYLGDRRQREGFGKHLASQVLDALTTAGLHITHRPTREDIDR